MHTAYADILATLPEPLRLEAVTRALVQLMRDDNSGTPRIGPQPCTFGRRATDRVVPSSYVGMKTADAVEAILRQDGRPLTKHELIGKLQAEGCEVTLKNLCISVGSNAAGCNLAKRPRFYEDGNLVGLVVWQERKAA